MDLPKQYFSKTSDTLIKVASIIGAIVVIAGAYTFYLNNFYVPKVDIVDIDFTKGTAKLKVGKKEINLIGDAVFAINNSWGVKFGNLNLDGKSAYNTVQLLKNGMVVDYIQKK